jgi:hypothetical protein
MNATSDNNFSNTAADTLFVSTPERTGERIRRALINRLFSLHK